MSLKAHHPSTEARSPPPRRPDVERMERLLRLFSDTLDEWLECQRQWLYLETIFSAADIQRQLPAEAKAFQQVSGRKQALAWGCGWLGRLLQRRSRRSAVVLGA